jgi:FkbM family methyltransferase
MLKSLANSLLRRRHLSLVGDWELDNFVAARHLRKVIDSCRIDCVLDVGANFGQFRDFVVKAGWNGPVVSFEPVKKYYNAIKARAPSSWLCLNYALGSADGTAEIETYDLPGFSSIREGDTAAMATLFDRAPVVNGREAIEVHRLSSVLQHVAPQAKSILLKSDTQGYDLEVFRGAAGVLDRISALWVELSFQPTYKGAPGYKEALAEFERAGFAVSAMFPVVHDEALRVIEYDCALVKTPLPP